MQDDKQKPKYQSVADMFKSRLNTDQAPENAMDEPFKVDDELYNKEIEEFYSQLEKEAPDLLPEDRRPKGLENFAKSVSATEKGLRSGGITAAAETAKSLTGQAADEQFVEQYPDYESKRLKDIELVDKNPEYFSNLTKEINKRRERGPESDPAKYDYLIEQKEQELITAKANEAGLGAEGAIVRGIQSMFSVSPKQTKVNEISSELSALHHRRDLIKRYGNLETAYNDLSAQLRSKSSYADQLLAKAEEIRASAPYYDPNTPSGFFGSSITSVLPSLAAIAAAPFTSGTSLSFLPAAIGLTNIVSLTAASSGMGMQEYKDYMTEKGYDVDRETMFKVGILNGAFEAVAESLRMPRWMPKGLFVKRLVKATIEKGGVKAVDKMLEEFSKRTGRNILKEFGKEMLQQGSEEGLEEVFTQIGQDIVNNTYKDEQDKATLRDMTMNTLQAAAGGFFAGAFLGAVRVPSISYMQRQARQKNGFITLAEVTGDGVTIKDPVVEVVGMQGDNALVYLPSGEQKMIDKKNIGQVESIPLEEFNNYKTAIQRSQADADKVGKEITEKQQQRKEQQASMNVAQALQHKQGGYVFSGDIGDNDSPLMVISGSYKLRDDGEATLNESEMYTVMNPVTFEKKVVAGKFLTKAYYEETPADVFAKQIAEGWKVQRSAETPAESPELARLKDKLTTNLRKETEGEIIELSDVSTINDDYVLVTRINKQDWSETPEQMSIDEALDFFQEEIAQADKQQSINYQNDGKDIQGQQVQGDGPKGNAQAEALQPQGQAPAAATGGNLSSPDAATGQQQQQAISYPLTKDGQPDIDNMTDEQLFAYNKEQFGEETAIADLQDEIRQVTDKIAKAEKKLSTADTKGKIKGRAEIQTLKDKKAQLEKLMPQADGGRTAAEQVAASPVAEPVQPQSNTQQDDGLQQLPGDGAVKADDSKSAGADNTPQTQAQRPDAAGEEPASESGQRGKVSFFAGDQQRTGSIIETTPAGGYVIEEEGTGEQWVVGKDKVKALDEATQTTDQSEQALETMQPQSQAEQDAKALDQLIASQQHNNNPTEKQKETGIYDKARISLQGHNITLETLKGQQRSGVDANGKAWSITMNNHYGELDGTVGYDGDAIDVFVGPNPNQGQVFVVDQVDPKTGAFDESKVLLGFDSAEQAKDAYMSNYETGWKGFGSITPAGDKFKKWLYDGKKQRKPYAEYTDTPAPVKETKQPWEMTLTYVMGKASEKDIPTQSKVEIVDGKPLYTMSTTVLWDGKERTISVSGKFQPKIEKLHKAIIQQALSEGKQVPEEVLRDYPELQAETKQPQAKKEGEKVTILKQRRRPATKSLSAIQQQALKIEVFTPEELALQYFIGGGKINKEAIVSLFGGGKGSMAEKRVESERKRRISYLSADGGTIESIAHQLWEDNTESLPQFETSHYRDAVESAILGFNSPVAMAKSLVESQAENNNHGYSDEQIAEMEAQENEKALQEERLIEEITLSLLDDAKKLGILPTEEEYNVLFLPTEYQKENENTTDDTPRGESNDPPATGTAPGKPGENPDEQNRQGSPDNTSGIARGEQSEETAINQRIASLKQELASTEKKYAEQRNRLEKSADHGGRGQANIFGVIEGGDLIPFDFNDKETRDQVNALRTKAEQLRKQISDEANRLEQLKIAKENQSLFEQERQPWEIDFDNIIKNSSKEEIEKAKIGSGISAAMFAKRYGKPGSDNYVSAYNTFFNYFKNIIEKNEQSPTEQQPEKPATAADIVFGEEKEYGADNKIFTEDAKNAALERLRAKRGEVKAGIDPQEMLDALTVGGYHIEAGARKFSDWASKMINDIGDWIKPYLKGTYENIRRYPGIDQDIVKAMTSTNEVDEFIFDAPKQEEQAQQETLFQQDEIETEQPEKIDKDIDVADEDFTPKEQARGGMSLSQVINDERSVKKTVFLESLNYSSKNITNKSDIKIPNKVIEDISENGITLERLDDLSSKTKVQVFKYRTQITIHGYFNEDVLSVNLNNYKNFTLNKNKSLGVRYNGIDMEKKRRIGEVLRVAGLENKDSDNFVFQQDSTGTRLQKSRIVRTQQELRDTVNKYKKHSEKINGFVGSKDVYVMQHPWFGVMVMSQVHLNAIYEKDLWPFIESVTDGVIANEEQFNELSEKQRLEREAYWKKQTEEREAEDAKKQAEFKEKSKPFVDQAPFKKLELNTEPKESFSVARLKSDYDNSVQIEVAYYTKQRGRWYSNAEKFKDWDSVKVTSEKTHGRTFIPNIKKSIDKVKQDAVNRNRWIVNIDGITQAKQAQPKTAADRIFSEDEPAKQKVYSLPVSFTIASMGAFTKALNKGEINAQQFKQAFVIAENSYDAIKDELSKKTKAELLKGMSAFGVYRYKNEVKDRVVKALADDYMMTFAFGTISYSHGETLIDAIRRNVEKVTQEDIDNYVSDRQKQQAEYEEKLKQYKKALENPETIDEFKIFIKKNGLDKLSIEQKARYDELVTDKVLDERSEQAERKAVVEKVDVGEVEFSIVESKHTKTGAQIFVVRQSERVSDETYKELVSKAKKLGGYYSSYTKGGAIPGYIFKTREAAEQFANINKQDAVSTATAADEEETTVKTVSKLRENAQKMIERADEELGRDRLTNTAKRAREAASTEARWKEEERIAQTMINIADAIENGDVKLLDGIKAKTHIQLLDGLIRSAKYHEISAKSNGNYSERQKYEGEPATLETIEYLKGGFLPDFFATSLKDLINKAENIKGVKNLAAKWQKKVAGTGEYDRYQTKDKAEVEEITQMFNALPERERKYNRIGDVLTDYKRLVAMGIENDSMLRAALREYIQYRGKKQAPDKVKELERAIVGRAKHLGIDFFPTPGEVARRMVDIADINENMDVLEPSAGNGNIADEIKEAGVMPEVIEISSELAEILKAKGYDVVANDFLEYTDKKYDRIIMNPPFSNGLDGEHLQHAYELLKPGGKIVAIVGEGTFIRSDKKATAFREWLNEVGGTETKLEAGTFQDKTLLNTTGANARMVVIEKEGEFVEDEPTVKKPSYSSDDYNNPEAWAKYINSVSDRSEVSFPDFLRATTSEWADDSHSDIKYFIDGKQLGEWATDINNKGIREWYNNWVEGKETYSEAVNKATNTTNKEPIQQTLELNPAQPINKLQDFGEKIGGARKDQDITRRVRETDSMPAWRRKYDYANADGTVMLVGKVDTTKPFIVQWSEEVKSRFGKMSRTHIVSEIKDGYITRDPMIFASEQDAENYIPIYEAIRQGFKINKNKEGKFVVYKRASNNKMLEFDSFDTKEEAETYLHSTEGATSLLNRKRETFSIPQLEKIERTGKDYRGGKNVTSDEFMEVFGFRGGEFGNWVKTEERQAMLNMAYDSFMDLADLIGISPKAISLGGELSIAFGARGSGGLEGGASAHYEPNRAVINLTRLKGAGAVAHEWMHALDNYFGLQNAGLGYERDEKGELKVKDVYLSEKDSYKAGMRKELKTIFMNILDRLSRKKVTRTIDQEVKQKAFDQIKPSINREAEMLKVKLENGARRYKYNRKTKQREEVNVKATPEQLSRANALIEKIVSGNSTMPDWKSISGSLTGEYSFISEDMQALDAVYKEVFGYTGLKRNGGGFYNFAYYANKLYTAKEMLEKAMQGEQETVKIKTELLENSDRFDAMRVSPYFAKQVEMMARSFEQFIVTKLAERGMKSDYLQYDKSPVYKSIYEITPYPEGDDLTELNELFQQFFDTVEERTDESGNRALFSLSQDEPFYSPTERALGRVNQEKGTAQQFKAMLLKNGAKQAEMDWMGWDEQFPDAGKMITKADIQQWIDGNKIEVQEVVKADKGGYFYTNEEGYERWKEEDDTKFSQYQTPGGENYKELLLTMPKKGLSDYEKMSDEMLGMLYSEQVGYNPFEEGGTREHVINMLRDNEGNTKQDNVFKSSHFSEPNILAHIRFNERTDADGNRVLFLEEVQSDWAQRGKKEGFNTGKSVYEIKEQPDGKFKIWNNQENEYARSGLDVEMVFEKAAYAKQQIQSMEKSFPKAPSMPFPKTDQWVNLALRRMIRYAAENGFDRIAWTTGDQQAERYDLSKQIDSITYNKTEDGLYSFSATKGNTELISKEDLTLSEVESNLGKEIAQKMSNDEGTELFNEDGDPINEDFTVRTLSGLDLKVGGSGMKAFYDNIIPSAANKLGKPFGAKVEDVEIPLAKVGDEVNGAILKTAKHLKDGSIGMAVQSLPVTQEMKKSVLGGVPLFIIAGEKGAANLDMAEEATTRLDNLRVAKEMENGRVRKPLFEDEYGKQIVYNDGYFRIAVDDIMGAKYVTLWHKEIVKDKVYWAKRGELYTGETYQNKGDNGEFKGKYLSIRSVEIDKDYRGQGLGRKMYKALEDFAADDIKGIYSYLPNRVNKKQVPSIYRRMGAKVVDGDHQFVNFKPKSFTPKQIRLATGWERGADGLWRYEIPDGKPLNLESTAQFGERELSEVIENDELFAAYPQLKDLPVSILPELYPRDNSGYRVHGNFELFNDGRKRINITYEHHVNRLENTDYKKTESLRLQNESKIFSVLNHEIQHAIQNIEGFSPGDSPYYSEYYNDNRKREEYERYRRVSGEVEARNVQSRMILTPEQKREQQLKDTEDVAREDQIFIKTAHKMASVKGESISSADKRNVIEQLNERSQSVVGTRFVETQNDLPAGVKSQLSPGGKVKGVLYGNTTYYVLDNIANEHDALMVWMHEHGIHHGITRLIPNREARREFLERVVDDIGLEEIQKVIPRSEMNNDKHIIGEEYIAYLTNLKLGGEVLDSHQQGVWERFLAFIQKWIDKALQGKVKITEADVLRVAEAAIKSNFNGQSEAELVGKDADVTRNFVAGKMADATVNATRRSKVPRAKFASERIFGLMDKSGNYIGDGTFHSDYSVSDFQNYPQITSSVSKSDTTESVYVTYRNTENGKTVTVRFSNHENNATKFGDQLNGNTATDNEILYALGLKQRKFIPNVKKLIDTRQVAKKELSKYEESDKTIQELYSLNANTDISEHKGKLAKGSNYLIYGDKVEEYEETTRNILGQYVKKGRYEYFDIDTKRDPDIRFSIATEEGEQQANAPLPERFTVGRPEKFIELVQDKYIRWKMLKDMVIERGGNVPEWADPYMHSTLTGSVSQAEMQEYDKKQWQPLMDVIKRIQLKTGLDLANLQKYLVFKHAPERNAQIRLQKNAGDDEVFAGEIDGVSLTDEYAEEQSARFEQLIGDELIAELWDKMNQATGFALQKYLDSGFINQARYDAIRKMYSHYVPLRGWAGDTPEDVFEYQMTTNSGNGFQNPLMKALGRKSQADEALPFLKAMAYSSIMAGNKNKLRQKALNMIRLNRDKMKDLFDYKKIYLVETDMEDDAGNKVSKEAVWNGENVYYIDSYDEYTGEPILLLAGKYVDLLAQGRISREQSMGHYARNNASKAQQHEFTVYEGGRKYVMVMKADPMLAESLNGKIDIRATINEKHAQEVINFTSKATRTLSMLLTSKNPAFIPVNFIRDISYAMMAHGIKDSGDVGLFLTSLKKAAKAIDRFERGVADTKNNADDAMFERFVKAGGRTGYAYISDIDDYRRNIQREVLRITGRNGRIDKLTQSQGIKLAGHTLNYLAVMSEDISRYATFMVSKAKGKSDSAAAYDAKNATVNFNQRGRIAPILGMGWAFANAAIQGGANVTKLAVKHPGKFAAFGASWAALGFVVAELMRLSLPDDDDYWQQINQYLRDNYMTLPNPAWLWCKGKDKYISIPLPHGFRALYSVGQATSDLAHGNTDPGIGGYTSRIVENVLDSFSPWDFNFSKIVKDGKLSMRPIVPTWMVPVYDISNNEDFAGRRVFKEMFTPTQEKYTPDSEKALSTTNPFLIETTRLLNKWAGGDESRPAGMTFNPKTGEIESEGLRNFADINPAKVEHLLEGYTGGLGSFINQSVKTIANGIQIAAGNQETAIDTKDVPVLNRLYRTIYQSNDLSDYYDLKTRVSDFKHYRAIYKDSNKQYWKIMLNNAEMLRNERFIDNMDARIERYNDAIKKLEGKSKEQSDMIKQRDEFIIEQINKQKTPEKP